MIIHQLAWYLHAEVRRAPARRMPKPPQDIGRESPPRVVVSSDNQVQAAPGDLKLMEDEIDDWVELFGE